jgi:hypothetical protein
MRDVGDVKNLVVDAAYLGIVAAVLMSRESLPTTEERS